MQISVRLAYALGMIPIEDWDDEPRVGAYFDEDRWVYIWLTETYQEPLRYRRVMR